MSNFLSFMGVWFGAAILIVGLIGLTALLRAGDPESSEDKLGLLFFGMLTLFGVMIIKGAST